MHERPLQIAAERRLQSSLALGGLRLEQTYSLAPEGDCGTRLSIRIVAGNSVPVLGATIDRFEVRQLATERVDSLLRSILKWCEARPDAQPRKRDATEGSSPPKTPRSNAAKPSRAGAVQSTAS